MEYINSKIIRDAAFQLVSRIIGVLLGLIVMLLIYWIAK